MHDELKLVNIVNNHTNNIRMIEKNFYNYKNICRTIRGARPSSSVLAVSVKFRRAQRGTSLCFSRHATPIHLLPLKKLQLVNLSVSMRLPSLVGLSFSGGRYAI